MRRIDLFCKLAGPLTIALITTASLKVAISVTLGSSVLSVPVEYYMILKVMATLSPLNNTNLT